MQLPKYTITKVSKHNGMFWCVFNKRKQIGIFNTKEEAERWVQLIVADDQWLAANS